MVPMWIEVSGYSSYDTGSYDIYVLGDEEFLKNKFENGIKGTDPRFSGKRTSHM